MTDDRHYYKHRETGIVAEILDRVAAIFGDHLELVEDPNPKAKRASKKKADPETTPDTDSSEGGNE